MKQVIKTPQVMERMRSAFGADVNVADLPVYEAVALNTQPLRKTSGMFKGARVTASSMGVISSQINAESAPIQIQHDTSETPYGRVFYAEVMPNDEMRVLFTCTSPPTQADLDNGTIDQVSVGYLPAHMNCSACGFDFLGDDVSFENLWAETCPDDHTIGEDGVFAWVDGSKSFFELSLVGKGAAMGAKIVGPSDSRLMKNPQYQLAASTGFAGVRLTASPAPTQKENPVDLTEVLAKLTASTTEKAELAVKVTGLEAQVATIAALQVRIAELEPLAGLQAQLDAAVTALKAEATTVLTACRKPVDNLPGDATALLTLIQEHRAQFAAVIPPGGRSLPADLPLNEGSAPSTAAFATRR